MLQWLTGNKQSIIAKVKLSLFNYNCEQQRQHAVVKTAKKYHATNNNVSLSKGLFYARLQRRLLVKSFFFPMNTVLYSFALETRRNEL